MISYQDADGVVRTLEMTNGALIDVEVTEIVQDSQMEFPTQFVIETDLGSMRLPDGGGMRIEICVSRGTGSGPFLILT
jgi:hypothetical protein